MKKIKVLHVHGGMNLGGTEAVIMNWYRNIDLNKYHFDFTSTFNNACYYDEEIKSKGGNIIYIAPVSKVGYLKHCIELYKVIKRGNYDIIHSHMNFHGGIVSLIGKVIGINKIICHGHSAQGVQKLSFKNKVLRILMIYFADERLACGYEAGKFIFKIEKNFNVINNPIDNKFFKERSPNLLEHLKKKYNIDKKKVIAQIGRIDSNKNHKFMLEVMREIIKVDKSYVFFIIGEGELKKEVSKEVKKIGLDKHIMFLGNKNNIDELMGIIDVVVMPSRYEGVPMVLLESQASGKKCIVSNNVSKEVDLNLGIIKFLSIDEKKSVGLWRDEILSCYTKNVNKDDIMNKIKERGYLLESIIEKLEESYKC